MGLAVDGWKECPGCTRTKPVSEFNKDRTRGDGYQVRCRQCQKRYERRGTGEYHHGGGFRPAGHKGLARFIIYRAIDDARGVDITKRNAKCWGGRDAVIALAHQWWLMPTCVLRDLVLDRAGIEIRGPELLKWVLNGTGKFRSWT